MRLVKITLLILTILNLQSVMAIDTSCKEFRYCEICKTKNGLINWMKDFEKKYGNLQSVLIKIASYELNKEQKGESPFPSEFYEEYGAFLLKTIDLVDDSYLLVLAKHLFAKGVHPYDRVNPGTTVAIDVVELSNVDLFKLMAETGKLTDCVENLTYLYNVAQRNDNERLMSLIQEVGAPFGWVYIDDRKPRK